MNRENSTENKAQPVPGWVAELDRKDLESGRAPDNPFTLFAEWFEQAKDSGMIEPTAMTLATVSADGEPSARTVLLKGFDEQGFRFYTNYESRKGLELAANGRAALVFWWDRLERQVRVRGQAVRLDPKASDEYFASRPRGSQIGAHASPQSRVIESRQTLEQRVSDVEARFEGGEVSRPEHWGGYCVQPAEIEFWQGRRSRLHDRLLYQQAAQGWQHTRLAP